MTRRVRTYRPGCAWKAVSARRELQGRLIFDLCGVDAGLLDTRGHGVLRSRPVALPLPSLPAGRGQLRAEALPRPLDGRLVAQSLHDSRGSAETTQTDDYDTSALGTVPLSRAAPSGVRTCRTMLLCRWLLMSFASRSARV